MKKGENVVVFLLVTGIFGLLFLSGYFSLQIGGPLVRPGELALSPLISDGTGLPRPPSCISAVLNEYYGSITDVSQLQTSSLYVSQTNPCDSLFYYNGGLERKIASSFVDGNNKLITIVTYMEIVQSPQANAYVNAVIAEAGTSFNEPPLYTFIQSDGMPENYLADASWSESDIEQRFSQDLFFIDDSFDFTLIGEFPSWLDQEDMMVLKSGEVTAVVSKEKKFAYLYYEENADGSGHTGSDRYVVPEPQFTLTYCGDGTRQSPNSQGINEQCDDGNYADGDWCSSSCQWESAPYPSTYYTFEDTLEPTSQSSRDVELRWRGDGNPDYVTGSLGDGIRLNLDDDTNQYLETRSEVPQWEELKGRDITVAIDVKTTETAARKSLFGTYSTLGISEYPSPDQAWHVYLDAGVPTGFKRIENDNNLNVYLEYDGDVPNAVISGDDGWHTVVFRKNGEEISLWVDGQLVDSDDSQADGTTENDDRFRIGVHRGLFTQMRIDELKIWESALTDNEILNVSGLEVPEGDENDTLPFDNPLYNGNGFYPDWSTQQLPSCSSLGGDVCTSSETCTGSSYASSDSNCCSVTCTPSPTPPVDPSCDWQPMESACLGDDVREIYYVNAGSAECDLTTILANTTKDADCDNDGFIGNESSIDFDNFEDGELWVDDKRFSQVGTVSGPELVEIKDDGQTVLEFEHDFDDGPLNLRGVSVAIQRDSTDYGFVVEDGIAGEKTMYILDRASSDDDTLCYQESADRTNDINPECDNSGEDELECPGTDGDVECTIEGDYYKVTGLTGTGVWELTEPDTDNCTPDWAGCTAWGMCSSGLEYRQCSDLNGCLTGQQQESRPCTTTPGPPQPPLPNCTPDWDCTDYPSTCPSDGIKRRTCTDLNSCGTSVGKPGETTRCDAGTDDDDDGESNALLWFVIAFLAVGILAIILLIVLKKRAEHDRMNTRKKGNAYQRPIVNTNQRRGPAGGYQRPF